MVLFVVTAIMMSLRYYQNEQFRKCFQYLQGFQLICLYLWYFAYHIPWSNSLPFYHCRLAMFAVLFLPDRWKSKQFFCFDGSEWSHLCLGLSSLWSYTFPHITSFSFLLGHYCLLINSLIYLLRWYDRNLLKNRQIVIYTFALDLFLVGVNQLTGGNYGLMAALRLWEGIKSGSTTWLYLVF